MFFDQLKSEKIFMLFFDQLKRKIILFKGIYCSFYPPIEKTLQWCSGCAISVGDGVNRTPIMPDYFGRNI